MAETVDNPVSTVENVEEAQEPRSIDELLLLDTYQSMTDDEIELVINFQAQSRCNNSILEEMLANQQAAELINLAKWQDRSNEAYEEYREHIDKAIARLDASYNLDFNEEIEAEPVEELEAIS